MKIFIDVGGHVGETVEAILDAGYGFEKIYSFERSAPALTDHLGKNEKSASSGVPSNRAPNLLGKQAGIPAKERRKIGTHVASKYYWR